ncbi:MAG: peptidylprolyl isomerase [Gemmatimonadaceae bacterium]|nr:peptidylprolyl isomerase [Gemmatimonadaceae bacterium]MCW5825611.1 peptidylprolyl isomerase [Gemmatimonadaceae bacterium]
MRRAYALAAIALLAAPVAAQQGGAVVQMIPVDRVVAVVATKPILFSEVLERLNFARAQGLQIPADSAGQMRVARELLEQLVDEEVLLAVAQDFKLEVPELEVSARVDQQIDQIRGQFGSEAEFREALRREGFGTPEEYRKRTIEQAQRDERQRKALDTLRTLGRLAPVNVTEREVAEAFERLRARLGPRPALVAFRQVVVTPRPRQEAKDRAYARTDSLRRLLERGADFDSLARLVSQDPVSAAQGGDLGWNRRGRMVAAFDQMMFALLPGRISPIVETEYGYHVMRVDRVRPGEVRARHILVRPEVDEQDAAVAAARADSARQMWQRGAPFDSVIARFHDANEEKSIPEGYPVDSLPPEYRVVLRNQPAGAFTEVFTLPDQSTGLRKYLVAQVISAKPAGQWTLDEYQERVRRQLQEERSTRRTLDNLRREYYVSVRL